MSERNETAAPERSEERMCSLGWSNYGARFYDASIGRFTTVVPLAEDYTFQTPYAYAANNPISFIDWMGMGPAWIDNGDGTYTAEAGDSAASLARDAGISIERANSLVEGQLGANRTVGGKEFSNVKVGDNVKVYNVRTFSAGPIVREFPAVEESGGNERGGFIVSSENKTGNQFGDLPSATSSRYVNAGPGQEKYIAADGPSNSYSSPFNFSSSTPVLKEFGRGDGQSFLTSSKISESNSAFVRTLVSKNNDTISHILYDKNFIARDTQSLIKSPGYRDNIRINNYVVKDPKGN